MVGAEEGPGAPYTDYYSREAENVPVPAPPPPRVDEMALPRVWAQAPYVNTGLTTVEISAVAGCGMLSDGVGEIFHAKV